jgi:hypothetical protein
MPNLNLITEPDKLFNENPSVLIITPSDAVKADFNERAKQFETDVNVYMYETVDPDDVANVSWLIDIINMANIIIFDVNGTFKDRWMIGYILNKNNCYYLWNGSQAMAYHLLNSNKIYDLEFLPNKIKELENR